MKYLSLAPQCPEVRAECTHFIFHSTEMPSSNESSHVHVTGPRKGVGVFLGEMWEESINKSRQPCRVPRALSTFIYLGPGSDYLRIFFQGHRKSKQLRSPVLPGKVSVSSNTCFLLFQAPRCLRGPSPSYSWTTCVTGLPSSLNSL